MAALNLAFLWLRDRLEGAEAAPEPAPAPVDISDLQTAMVGNQV